MTQRYFEINESGHNIRCKLYSDTKQDIRRVVIFCHGFGGHKDNAAAQRFAERMISKFKHTAMITFNWPCHGDDVKKKLTLGDCSAYLTLVCGYARRQFGTDALFCYATSFGGYLVLKYLSEHGSPFHKIALRCPAVNMHQVITKAIMTPENLADIRRGKQIPVGFDRKILIGGSFLKELEENDIQGRDYLDFAEDIRILHGTGDEIVPFAAGEAFAENNLIEFIPIPGADHRFRDTAKMDQAIKSILEFFFTSDGF